MEEFITITGTGNIRLKGCLKRQETGKAVVLSHPHPLYGGSMDVPLICRMADCFHSAGIATLRFNFRGTGGSSGKFDNGRGEQDDVRSVLDFLSDQGYDQLFLAGYSFGSWVNAHVVSAGVEICDHIMVSPPAALLSFDQVGQLPNTGLIVTGENDDLAPDFMVHDLLSKWKISPRVEVLSDVDHFYVDALDKLGDVLSDYLQSWIFEALEKRNLDRIDKKILNILQENGKTTNAKLSRMVGISAPATLERVKRLEAAGVISYFTAVVDPEKVGFSIMVIVSITLSLSKLSSVPLIKEKFSELDEVVECYQIAGAHDFILKVIAKDIKAYAEFMNQKLTQIQGIQSIQSSIVIDSLKDKRIFVLGAGDDS